MTRSGSEPRRQSAFRTYLKYIVVGAIVGVLTIGIRELIAMAIPTESLGFYALSVAIAYVFGILAGYIGHSRTSFAHVDMGDSGTARSILSFTIIALLGLVFTTGLSVAIRHFVPVSELFGSLGDAFAFALATLITSIITFYLNARHTFRAVPKEEGV